MKKRILSGLLALILALTCLPVRAAEEPLIRCQAVSGYAGGSVQVDVYGDNLQNIGALSLEFYYDASKFTVSDAWSQSLLSGCTADLNFATPGCVRVRAVSLEGITGSGPLLSLTVQLRQDCAPGDYTLAAVVGEVTDTAFTPVTVRGMNGKITVMQQHWQPETFSLGLSCGSGPFRKGDLVQVQATGNWQPLSAGEFTLTYDREVFSLEDAEISSQMAQPGAVHSVNRDTRGVLRISYATPDPVSCGVLFTARLRVLADTEGESLLTLRAQQAAKGPEKPYLPGKAEKAISLEKLPPVEQIPKMQLSHGEFTVGQETLCTLTLQKNSGVAAGDFTVSYDPAVFACLSVTPDPRVGEIGGTLVLNDNYREGQIRFSYIHQQAWGEADLPLVQIVLKPLKAPETHYALTPSGVGITDRDMRPVRLEYVTDSGCIFVKQVVLPTCTEPGYTEYTCPCGNSRREDPVPATGHRYEKDPLVCDICGQSRTGIRLELTRLPEQLSYRQKTDALSVTGGQVQLTFPDGNSVRVPLAPEMVTGFDNSAPGTKMLTVSWGGASTEFSVEILPWIAVAGANMTLGNELAMNFMVKKADVADLSGLSVQITKSFADGRAPVTVQIPFAGWKPYGRTYYSVTFDDISAKEMTDEIQVQLLRDGSPAGPVYTDSVERYALRVLRGGRATALLKPVIVDMLNYGAAAQEKFRYHPDAPANGNLTAGEQALASPPAVPEDIRVRGEHYYGSNLNLGSSMALTLFFRDITPDMHGVICYTKHTGEEKEISVNGGDFVKFNDHIFGIRAGTLVVADARQPVTVTVYDAENRPIGSGTDSIAGYVARSSKLGNLGQAILKFAASAEAYFAGRA